MLEDIRERERERERERQTDIHTYIQTDRQRLLAVSDVVLTLIINVKMAFNIHEQN